MSQWQEILQNMARSSQAKERPGDWRDVSTGILHCGVCGEAKESTLAAPICGMNRIVRECACDRAQRETERAEAQRSMFEAKMKRIRIDGISDPYYREPRFESAEGSDKILRVCRKYADKFGEMKSKRIGMLLYGDVGTGKTFMACCIANALLERMIPSVVTSFPRLLLLMQDIKSDRTEILDRLNECEFLVIDDMGAERSTEYAMEQVFQIIDSRYRSGLPVAITTNIPADRMAEETDPAKQRIFDRILDMCPIRIPFSGTSRRKEQFAERRKAALEIIKGE